MRPLLSVQLWFCGIAAVQIPHPVFINREVFAARPQHYKWQMESSSMSIDHTLSFCGTDKVLLFQHQPFWPPEPAGKPIFFDAHLEAYWGFTPE